jgi:hypothetical protein
MNTILPPTSGGTVTLTDRLKVWWLNKLDNDSVRQWVPPYCAAWLTWALLATFWLPAVPTIEPIMGHLAYVLWVWLAIPGNLFPTIGLWMRHGGSAVGDMSNRLLFRDWMGLILQATGHAACHVLLVMFQISAWVAVANYTGPSAYAGMTLFCAIMLTPWTFGVLLLCAQCVRKIQRGLKFEQQGMVA